MSQIFLFELIPYWVGWCWGDASIVFCLFVCFTLGLMYKHEDLSSDTQYSCNKSGLTVYACNSGAGEVDGQITRVLWPASLDPVSKPKSVGTSGRHWMLLTSGFYTHMHICACFPTCIYALRHKHNSIHTQFSVSSFTFLWTTFECLQRISYGFWSSFPVHTRNRKFLGVSVILGHPVDHGWWEQNYEVRGPLAWRGTNSGISLYSRSLPQDQTEVGITLDTLPVIDSFPVSIFISFSWEHSLKITPMSALVLSCFCGSLPKAISNDISKIKE